MVIWLLDSCFEFDVCFRFPSSVFENSKPFGVGSSHAFLALNIRMWKFDANRFRFLQDNTLSFARKIDVKQWFVFLLLFSVSLALILRTKADRFWSDSLADRTNIYLFACGLLVTSRYQIVLVQAGVGRMRGSHYCRSRRIGADLRLDILSIAKSKKMARSPPRTHQVQVARRGMILCWQEHEVMDIWLML